MWLVSALMVVPGASEKATLGCIPGTSENAGLGYIPGVSEIGGAGECRQNIKA